MPELEAKLHTLRSDSLHKAEAYKTIVEDVNQKCEGLPYDESHLDKLYKEFNKIIAEYPQVVEHLLLQKNLLMMDPTRQFKIQVDVVKRKTGELIEEQDLSMMQQNLSLFLSYSAQVMGGIELWEKDFDRSGTKAGGQYFLFEGKFFDHTGPQSYQDVLKDCTLSVDAKHTFIRTYIQGSISTLFLFNFNHLANMQSAELASNDVILDEKVYEHKNYNNIYERNGELVLECVVHNIHMLGQYIPGVVVTQQRFHMDGTPIEDSLTVHATNDFLKQCTEKSFKQLMETSSEDIAKDVRKAKGADFILHGSASLSESIPGIEEATRAQLKKVEIFQKRQMLLSILKNIAQASKQLPVQEKYDELLNLAQLGFSEDLLACDPEVLDGAYKVFMKTLTVEFLGNYDDVDYTKVLDAAQNKLYEVRIEKLSYCVVNLQGLSRDSNPSLKARNSLLTEIIKIQKGTTLVPEKKYDQVLDACRNFFGLELGANFDEVMRKVASIEAKGQSLDKKDSTTNLLQQAFSGLRRSLSTTGLQKKISEEDQNHSDTTQKKQ